MGATENAAVEAGLIPVSQEPIPLPPLKSRAKVPGAVYQARKANITPERTKNQIKRILARHPNVTTTMIQCNIRPFYRGWRMLLEELVESGEVTRNVKVVNGRGSILYSLVESKTGTENS